LGIQYQQLQVDESDITFNKAADNADIHLQGRYRISYTPGKFSAHDVLPSFRNPGAAISIGTALRTRDNFNIQFNLKNVGFIHWYKSSTVSDFDYTLTAPDLSTKRREDNLYATVI
jgi:hypothetical protein